MATPEPSHASAGGGCLLALAILVGVVIGLVLHQPTIGFLCGLAIGIVTAILIWRINRRGDPK